MKITQIVFDHSLALPASQQGELALSSSSYSGDENTNISFTILRTEYTNERVSVDWAITNANVTPNSGTVVFEIGDDQKIVSPLAGEVGPNEVGTLTISNPVNLDAGLTPAIISPSTATFTIIDITGVQSVPVTIVGSGLGAVTFGHVFKEGDYPSSAQVTGGQVNVKTRWPDNSIRFAVVSGEFTGGNVINITGGSSGGTDLTEAQLISALGTTTMTLSGGVSGTLNAADLISNAVTPDPPGKIAWQDGPHCIERIVGKQISGTVYGYFHCRLYSNDAVSVDFVVENCEAITAPANTVSGVSINFVLNGSPVYTDPSQTLYRNCRFMETFWDSDPGLRAQPDLDYFYSTKATMRYRDGTVTVSSPYMTSVSWDDIGDLPVEWGQSLAQRPYIGPLPAWDVACLRSGFADHYDAVLANAKAVNHHSCIYKDSATGYPVDKRNHALANINGWTPGQIPEGAGADLVDEVKSTVRQITHSPQEGYLAYILTGKYYHLETMWYLATNGILQPGSNAAKVLSGPPEYIIDVDVQQARGAAWLTAHLSKAAFLAPDGHAYAGFFETWISNMFDDINARYVLGSENNVFGLTKDYHVTRDTFRTFMHDFATGAYLEAHRMGLGGSNASAVAAYVAKWVQGRISYQDNVDFCWQRGPGYDYGNVPPYSSGTDTWLSDWATYYADRFPGAPTCDITGEFDQSYTGGYYTNMVYPVTVAHELGFIGDVEFNRYENGYPTGVFDISDYDTTSPTEHLPCWSFFPRDLTPAPTWVSALSTGVWTPLPNTNQFEDVHYSNNSGWGNMGPHAIHLAYSGAALAENLGTNGSILHWGGGHSDYFGNEVYRYDLETCTWSRITERSPEGLSRMAALEDITNGIYNDGTPAVPHTYQRVLYRSATREFVTIAREINRRGGYTSGGVSRMNVDTGTWINSLQGTSSKRDSIPFYDEARDALWVGVFDEGGGTKEFKKYDFAGDSWTIYQSLPQGNGSAACYIPTIDAYIYWASDLTGPRVVDCASPTTAPYAVSYNSQPWTPTEARKDCARWSSVLGAVIYYRNDSNELYKITPPASGDWRTQQWTQEQITTSGSAQPYPSQQANGTATYGQFQVAEWGDNVVALLNHWPDIACKALKIQ